MTQTRRPAVDGDRVPDGGGLLQQGQDELIHLLTGERHRLEILLLRLESARELVVAGELAFLPWTTGEIEDAVTHARESELVRALLVHRLADDLDVPEHQLTLGAMAEGSDEPYATIFAGHRRALRELVVKIEQAGAATRHLAARGVQDLERVNPALPSLVDFLR